MVKQVPPIQTSEITRDNLMSDEAILYLGAVVAKSLELFGQVNLLLSGSGSVAIANPVHVYFSVDAYTDEDVHEAPPYKWVRPVLGQGKPQFVAWRNGELWEIEFSKGDPNILTKGDQNGSRAKDKVRGIDKTE